MDQTDLIPGDNCVVAFREKVELLRDGLEIKETVDRVAVLPDGLNIKGEVNIVTEEEFEALTSKLWPQLSLAERIRQKNTSLESAGAAGKKGSKSYRMDLAFLIEYLILSGGESLDEATELNDGLSVLATESKDVNSTGLSYMLSLLIATVRELPHETALAAWTDWLESNDGWRGDYQLTGGDEYNRQMEWFWYIWNEHLSLLSLSNEQRSLLNAIKASAQARITADDLRAIFEQITLPSETPSVTPEEQ
jgi:hypothetical protein